MPKMYPAEVRDRAVRLVLDRLSEYPSVYAACKAVAPKLDVGPESLLRWVMQSQVDAGQKDGPTTDELEEPRRLRAEVRDLVEANEILKGASIFLSSGNYRRPSAGLRVYRPSQGRGPCGRVDLFRPYVKGVQVAAPISWKTRLPALRAIEDAKINDTLRSLQRTRQ